jgi:hypothetical protein
MGRELNKGEASHDLSRFLCFGKEDALRGREFGDQLHTFSCLRGWFDQERLFLIGKQQLEQDLRDWETAEAAQKNDALLSGLKLNRTRTWLVTHPLQLSLAERQFIEESLNLSSSRRG